MVSLTFGLFTQVSGLGPLGPLVFILLSPLLNFCIFFFSFLCLFEPSYATSASTLNKAILTEGTRPMDTFQIFYKLI